MQRGEPKRNVDTREVRRWGSDGACPRRRRCGLDDRVMDPKAIVRKGMVPSYTPRDLSSALTTRLKEFRDAEINASIRGMVVWRAKV